jgi:hypothetical protein
VAGSDGYNARLLICIREALHGVIWKHYARRKILSCTQISVQFSDNKNEPEKDK